MKGELTFRLLCLLQLTKPQPEQKNARAQQYLDFFQDDDNMVFLVDITSHLNELNLKFRQRQHCV